MNGPHLSPSLTSTISSQTTTSISHAVPWHFSVAGEDKYYRLKVSRYTSSSQAGDALKWHNGMRFSTPDRDNDALLGKAFADAFLFLSISNMLTFVLLRLRLWVLVEGIFFLRFFYV